MAKQLLTLADLAARRGVDKEVGLVQQVVNYAPEITTITARTVPGTFSEAKVQVSIPQGGVFPGNNAGVAVSAGVYEKRRFNAFFFDSELEIRESELIAASQVGDSLGDLQADEVAGALQQKAIKFSQQFYAGTGNGDANGFPGLQDLLTLFQKVKDTRTGKNIVNTVNAGSAAATASTECVWYVWNHPQGVHFIYGGDQLLDINPWMWMYLGGSAARYRAMCSNIRGFIGLMCAHPFAVACIKNIDASNLWTDKLSAQLHALLPVGIKPTYAFATKRAIAGLQQGRTVTLFGQGADRPNQPTIAPIPVTDVMGVPIIPTDGIQLQAAF